MQQEDPANRPERRSFMSRLAAIGGGFLLAGSTNARQGDAEIDRVTELERKLEGMQRQIGMLEDLHAIRKLQHAYGYYLDKCLYEETVKLFSETGEVHFMGGIWRGMAGIRRLYIGTFQAAFTDGHNGPLPGFLLDHPQLQDIIDVAPDRASAKGRFRTLMQAGFHESSDAPMARRAREQGRPPAQWWEGGIYENEYVRENGTWKIRKLGYNPIWHADFDKGWAYTRPEYVPAQSQIYPDNPTGPDELDPDFLGLWPNTRTVPFHYPHPVTGGES